MIFLNGDKHVEIKVGKIPDGYKEIYPIYGVTKKTNVMDFIKIITSIVFNEDLDLIPADICDLELYHNERKVDYSYKDKGLYILGRKK